RSSPLNTRLFMSNSFSERVELPVERRHPPIRAPDTRPYVTARDGPLPERVRAVQAEDQKRTIHKTGQKILNQSNRDDDHATHEQHRQWKCRQALEGQHQSVPLSCRLALDHEPDCVSNREAPETAVSLRRAGGK